MLQSQAPDQEAHVTVTVTDAAPSLRKLRVIGASIAGCVALAADWVVPIGRISALVVPSGWTDWRSHRGAKRGGHRLLGGVVAAVSRGRRLQEMHEPRLPQAMATAPSLLSRQSGHASQARPRTADHLVDCGGESMAAGLASVDDQLEAEEAAATTTSVQSGRNDVMGVLALDGRLRAAQHRCFCR